MIDNIKRINNPLTIIAIFAALAEISATVAIGLIDNNLHYIFIWFLIGFPSLLVILFFVTLNFNTKVMYSPSDYKDEKDFVNVLFANKEVSYDLEKLNDKFKLILERRKSEASNTHDYDELTKISDEIEKIKEKTQQIPINNAWDLNHWGSNCASIIGDKIVFTGTTAPNTVDGCNVDLIDFLELGKTYEISCFAKSAPNTSGMFQLWCHDKAGEPNGVTITTRYKIPSVSGEIVKLNFKATFNQNIRIHLQYTPGEGSIEVSDVRVKFKI